MLRDRSRRQCVRAARLRAAPDGTTRAAVRPKKAATASAMNSCCPDSRGACICDRSRSPHENEIEHAEQHGQTDQENHQPNRHTSHLQNNPDDDDEDEDPEELLETGHMAV